MPISSMYDDGTDKRTHTPVLTTKMINFVITVSDLEKNVSSVDRSEFSALSFAPPEACTGTMEQVA